MSWIDLFCPDNSERRESLIRKNQELHVLMRNNFRATNQLIDVLKEHLGLSFSKITLNEKATVKENCDKIIARIREIQAEVEKINQQLKQKLEPTLYEKLKNKSLSECDFQPVLNVVRRLYHLAAISSAVALVAWLISNVTMMTSITVTFGLIAIGVMGCVVFGVLCMGIGLILGNIVGKMERDRLERALKEYDKALEEFRPASEKYQDSITYVRISIQMMQ
ncbi:Single-pass membrane and coiled-coil domain-containing protein 3 [Labeo rohita]|uniref:Single-pass membrane and coiled-coil domain-containing protein 3 n=1 Tax=Labeo rohita TaxID=84645 RepID=A0ABQ8LAA0_LABRO|nr:single-pass membrane and coiled-coil domain-containing protein 3 isoform X2 [Labeo rohita]KAI2647687.1 Single-pass membrane and coiled-coil domain-containing protein 3 [Labeo rohita]